LRGEKGKSKELSVINPVAIPSHIFQCDSMSCPKCSSEKTNRISATYPVTLECGSCGLMFMQNPRALIDE